MAGVVGVGFPVACGMNLSREARRLASALARRRCKLVLAESCTAGLVSAALARVPGISQWHCGSAVVYREHTKQQWLGVSRNTLRRCSAVSAPVARQMALGVLRRTPEADLAAAITGHLGPEAPPQLDGVVFIALCCRRGSEPRLVGVWRHVLEAAARLARQREAAAQVLRTVAEYLLDAYE
jgi:nicotinamide-nucleotide amidase